MSIFIIIWGEIHRDKGNFSCIKSVYVTFFEFMYTPMSCESKLNDIEDQFFTFDIFVIFYIISIIEFDYLF